MESQTWPGRPHSAPPNADVPKHLYLVASSGGHLSQLMALRPWWRPHQRTWVTFEGLHASSLLDGERVRWAYHPTTRNIPNLIRNAFLALRLLRRDRPDIIVSTGAGVALPFFVIGRLLGIPTAFIEVYDRVDMPTLTGRLVRRFSSAFLLQWEEQLHAYPEGLLVGALL